MLKQTIIQYLRFVYFGLVLYSRHTIYQKSRSGPEIGGSAWPRVKYTDRKTTSGDRDVDTYKPATRNFIIQQSAMCEILRQAFDLLLFIILFIWPRIGHLHFLRVGTPFKFPACVQNGSEQFCFFRHKFRKVGTITDP